MSQALAGDAAERALFTRFDRVLPPRWLGRFVTRRPLRNLGPLRLYLCQREHHGPRWPVLVGRAVADGGVARRALDAVASAHGRLSHPWIAGVAERASAGELEFLVFGEPARSDLASLLALSARRALSALPYGAGEGLSLGVLDALAHAHARGETLDELGAGQLLVGSDGACRLFGFGGLGPLLRGEAARPGPPDAARAFPRDARDVCLWAAFVRGQRAVFARPDALRDAQRTEPPHTALPWLSQSVDALERTLLAARSPLGAEHARALLVARHARLGVVEPERAMRAAFAALVAEHDAECRSHTSPGHGERYLLEAPIGRGAGSTVFKAWDRQLRQHVAIKRLSASAGAESMARLLREVRTLRAVRHPQLVSGYELYEDRGQVGVVMEYVPGPTLRDLLVQRVLPPAEAREALAQVADALAELHRMGIAHRDVKPANVIVSPGRGAVLVDFGVVSAATHTGASTATLTLPGCALGEPRYLAPELLAGARASCASDVYALALSACDALSLGHTPAALDGLHEPLRTCLARALSAEPSARPSAQWLAVALRAEPTTSGCPARAISLDGCWLTSAAGERVELTRRSTLRRLLSALAQAHSEAPARAVSRVALFAVGWPGERIDETSAANRVYVAVAELRRLGLRGLLLSDGDGYRLDGRGVRVVAERTGPAQ